MSRVCSVCEKARTTGNLISHSNRKTRRVFDANLQKVRVVENGNVTTEYVCTRCLKSGKVERV